MKFKIEAYLKNNAVCLAQHEAELIAETIGIFEECNLLIFGVGNDSRLWIDINGGQTYFIEDDKGWSEKILLENKGINIVNIEYPKNITKWKELLDKPEELALPMPSCISDVGWDVIFVDGPLGNYKSKKVYTNNEPPGRMYSIFMAAQLIRPNGYVLVHDCCREIEIAFSDKFLGESNLDIELFGGYRGGKGVLRRYKIKDKNG